jgi:nitrate reductase gamma subunit
VNIRTSQAAGTPDDSQRKYRRRQRYLRIGQALIAIGFVVAFIHWLAHLEAFGPAQPEGWIDLIAGYPMGALLIIAGAILMSRKAA